MLSILYIGINLESFWMFIPYFFTKLWLIKISVALESTSACTDRSFNMSVETTEIGRYREVSQALRVLMVGC